MEVRFLEAQELSKLECRNVKTIQNFAPNILSDTPFKREESQQNLPADYYHLKTRN
jgi:hypothetical protein